MLSVNPPTQCSGTPSDTRLSVNPFVVAPRQDRALPHTQTGRGPGGVEDRRQRRILAARAGSRRSVCLLLVLLGPVLGPWVCFDDLGFLAKRQSRFLPAPPTIASGDTSFDARTAWSCAETILDVVISLVGSQMHVLVARRPSSAPHACDRLHDSRSLSL